MKRDPIFEPCDYHDEILAWIASGQTLRDYSRQEGKPSRPLINNWRQRDPAFDSRFARARDDGFDAIAEDSLDIADEDPATVSFLNEKGEEISTRIDPADVQNRKLRIETRHKLLAKWDPRRYGDKVGIEHSVDSSLGAKLDAATQRVLAARQKTLGSVGEEEGDNVG